jgi:hypothetical protein
MRFGRGYKPHCGRIGKPCRQAGRGRVIRHAQKCKPRRRGDGERG